MYRRFLIYLTLAVLLLVSAAPAAAAGPERGTLVSVLWSWLADLLPTAPPDPGSTDSNSETGGSDAGPGGDPDGLRMPPDSGSGPEAAGLVSPRPVFPD